MENKNSVNLLNGKEWLKNAINVWTMETDDIAAVFERMKAFCYKDRTGAGYINNLPEHEENVQATDFSFNYVTSLQSAKKALLNIFCGKAKSYHAICLDKEFIESVFIIPYFTKSLIEHDIEYRGKIIVTNRVNEKIYYILLFLKTNDKSISIEIDIPKISIKTKIEPSYVIDTKSKMDKIGLQHPAPFSYIDIGKICSHNNIVNKTILDPFLGVGSTIIGAYETNKIIGIELNPTYVDLTYERLDLLGIRDSALKNSTIICGDSLQEIRHINNMIDVVITSPPYFNILKNATSGVRTDSSQSRQGIQYYSNNDDDIGNCNSYPEYLQAISALFTDIYPRMANKGEVYLIISDFTINKRETDVHSDYIKLMNDIGYYYCGTSYIMQNQKTIYPFGYPYKIVLNHIYQYIIKFSKER